MTYKVTRKEVADQFATSIQLLLDLIDQSENSTKMGSNKTIDNHFSTPRLLTAPEVARVLNISKANAYKLIQQKEIHSVRINRNVRVRQEGLQDFITKNRV